MINIDASSLKDFQMCSLLYDYRYGEGKRNEYVDIRDRRAKRFDEVMKRVIAFFFYKKQAKAEPSYQALLNRWQKLWFAAGTTAADITNAKNEIVWNSDTTYTTQAAHALLQFHEEFSNKSHQEVVLVDEKFTVPLTKEITIEGIFDVVLREKMVADNKYHYKIYKWTTIAAKRPSSFWTFDIAILDYAFRHRNKTTTSASYFLWNFGGNTIGTTELILDREDFDLLKFWADIVRGTKIFAPRRGLTAYCKSCPFDTPCSRWSPPKVLNEQAT